LAQAGAERAGSPRTFIRSLSICTGLMVAHSNRRIPAEYSSMMMALSLIFFTAAIMRSIS
jgi:hypothetical protein